MPILEQIDAYIFTVKADKWDSTPQVILVIENTEIASGTWMSLVDARIEGILYGLELANYEIKTHKIEIISEDPKESFDATKLMANVS